MAEFNRLEIVRTYVEKAASVDSSINGDILILTATADKHTIVVQRNTKVHKLISVELDKTEILGVPNPLSDRLSEEIYDTIAKRSKELNRIAFLDKSKDKVR